MIIKSLIKKQNSAEIINKIEKENIIHFTNQYTSVKLNQYEFLAYTFFGLFELNVIE